MRLELITLPYLESNMTGKDFADTVGLSPSRVSQIIIRDLNKVYYKLFQRSDFDLRRIPRDGVDRAKWVKIVNDYKREFIKTPGVTPLEIIIIQGNSRVGYGMNKGFKNIPMIGDMMYIEEIELEQMDFEDNFIEKIIVTGRTLSKNIINGEEYYEIYAKLDL